MTAPRRFITDEGHASGGMIFAAIACGIAALLVVAIVVGAFA